MIGIIESLPLLNSIKWVLLFFASMQFILFVISVLFSIHKGVFCSSIRLFFRKEHLHDNWFMTWSISVFSYVYFLHLLNAVNADALIEETLQIHPYISWYVLLGTISLCIYIPIDTIRRFFAIQIEINRLKKFEIVKPYFPFLRWLSLGIFGIPFFIGIGMGMKGIEAIIARAVQNEIAAFFFRSSLELGVRISIIVSAVYCATSKIIYW